MSNALDLLLLLLIADLFIYVALSVLLAVIARTNSSIADWSKRHQNDYVSVRLSRSLFRSMRKPLRSGLIIAREFVNWHTLVLNAIWAVIGGGAAMLAAIVNLSISPRFIVPITHIQIARTTIFFLIKTIQYLITPFALLTFVFVCVQSRKDRLSKLKAGIKPRLVWGPYPNASALDISRALRNAGYVCDTYVYYSFDRIWDAEDFTFCLTEHIKKYPEPIRLLLTHTVLNYWVFLHIVKHYDIIHGFFYPGYLRNTPLADLEAPLLHLAGCKIVTVSIGGDVAYLTNIKSLMIRQGFNDFYPHTARNQEQDRIKRTIKYYTEHSDFIVCQSSYMIDALPRWDVLVTQYFPIDLNFWKSDFESVADGRNGVVRIGHSPNHRPLKGTNFLIKAVNELRLEGLKIELMLLENIKNKEVKETLSRCDIVVADLVLQGYSYMAIEGMALGKPVVQDISDEHYNRVFKLYTGLDKAPFALGRIENLRETLRDLVTSPSYRKDLGEKGRAYVEKFHSFDACERFWTWVYEYLWFARRPRAAFYHPDSQISTVQSLNMVTVTPDDQSLHDKVVALLKPIWALGEKIRVGFYPFSYKTQVAFESLIKTRAIRSQDYLVSPIGDEKWIPNLHYSQAIVLPDEIDSHPITHICRVQGDQLGVVEVQNWSKTNILNDNDTKQQRYISRESLRTQVDMRGSNR